MLTTEQEKWVAHLRDDDQITIKPYDPTAPAKFEAVKKRLQSALGGNLKIEHRGATSLGISGQDEVDVYVPVIPEQFDDLLSSLVKILGEPRSLYPLERARFVTNESGKHIDVFLVNKASPDWINACSFEKYLRENPKTLDAYRKLKEGCDGLSTREYYRRKIEFINSINIKIQSR